MKTAIQQAAELLADARCSGQRVRLPQTVSSRDAAAAYAIQDAIGTALGAPSTAPAWKVGAADRMTEPNAAPIYRVLPSPARISAASMGMCAAEAEVAFGFARALPPRPEPYARGEVFAAVRELRVAIEICDSRLEDWETADDMSTLADHQLNYALVLGDACERFDAIDFAALAVTTRVDGKLLDEGTGCHAVGNPLELLPWLVNHARTRGGIAAGTTVTTGAWLGLHRIGCDAVVEVEFAGLGRARATFF